MSDYADSLATVIMDYWKRNRLIRIELDSGQESIDLLPTYKEYIASDEWKEKSRQAKERSGYRCQLCNRKGTYSTLHTHHRTYERLGLEFDDDLIVLCNKCHKKHHDIKLHEDFFLDDYEGDDVRF